METNSAIQENSWIRQKTLSFSLFLSFSLCLSLSLIHTHTPLAHAHTFIDTPKGTAVLLTQF